MNREKKTYLKPNRLADVIALIQVLAFHKFYRRTVDGLNSELQGTPKSARSWDELAINHPEFFRVINCKDDNEEKETPKISLISRHVKFSNDNIQSETLSPDLVKKFIETAIELHDIQKERARRIFIWSPLIVAAISILGTFFVQYDSNQKQAALKHYEVELKPKQESYANFMKNITRAYYSAHAHNHIDYLKAIEESESSIYTFEPFLSPSDQQHIWNDYQQFKGLCSVMLKNDTTKKNNNLAFKSYDLHKKQFRSYLYNALFIETKENKKPQ